MVDNIRQDKWLLFVILSLGVDNYMLKLRELDAKKKRMIIIVSVLVLFIGVSFAYVVAQISGGALVMLMLLQIQLII